MKMWNEFGSEHSSNLVLIGKFKDPYDALKAKKLIDDLASRVNDGVSSGNIAYDGSTRRFSPGMLNFLMEANFVNVGPAELEQLAFESDIKVSGNEITVRTDESDVSAFIKVMIHNGAKIEMFSAHDYPE